VVGDQVDAVAHRDAHVAVDGEVRGRRRQVEDAAKDARGEILGAHSVGHACRLRKSHRRIVVGDGGKHLVRQPGHCRGGDGDPIPARVVQAPWLRTLVPVGEVSVVFETADGTVRIDGQTVLSTHDITDPSEIPPEMLKLMANWSFPALQQAGVRYTWDGEETYGMLERSMPMDQLVDD
jgi:hypothetical protein